MDEIDRILRAEAEQLELLLCRLTALRALVASGDAPLITRAVNDVESAALVVDQLEERRRLALADMGVASISLADLAVGAEPGYRELLEGHRERLVGLERRLRQTSRGIAVAAQRSMERTEAVRTGGADRSGSATVADAYGRTVTAHRDGGGHLMQGAL